MLSVLGFSPTKMGLWGSVLSVFPVLIATYSHATVLEYDTAGKVTVTETQTRSQAAVEVDPTAITRTKSSKLRELTREVAVQFSGSEGVRQAGLDALTFIEVFELLIQRESAFNPVTVSEKGAKGLGQLMPDTASDMGVTDPFDPRQNLIGSAKYFSLLLKRFRSLEHALAAYNAGPERVKQYRGVPPFKETQAYVTWIMTKAGIEKLNTQPQNVAAPIEPKTKTEAPLKGDVSVWEF